MSTQQKTVTITVAGLGNTGKTLIAALVKDALEKAGFQDIEYRSDDPSIDNLDDGLKLLKDPVAMKHLTANKCVIEEKHVGLAMSMSPFAAPFMALSGTPNK